MIVKAFRKEEQLLKMEALQNRLRGHFPDVTDQLKKLRAGYNGEKAIAYYLDFLPDNDFFVFHNLRLPSGSTYFQLDYLILTSRFLFILECKNFFGTLFFDDNFTQMIRKTDTNEQGFQNPLSQARRHQQQLYIFLRQHGITRLPVEYLVAISDPATILTTNSSSKQLLQKVVHGYNLLDRIKEISGKYQAEIIDAKTVRKISKLLLKQHTPSEIDILKKFSLTAENVQSGVLCEACGKFGMARIYGDWKCPCCGHRDKSGHIHAVHDYFLIIKPSITNKEFREFIHLPDPDMANYLLRTMKLPYSGVNRGRVYHTPQGFPGEFCDIRKN